MTPETTSAPTGRLDVLDALRGFIMIFMALDHASMFIALQHYSESWGIPLPVYPSALSLFTRVISHLCAPGFFFLMGLGMHFFWTSRTARGWSQARITKHYLKRGAVLIAMDVFMITPAWVIGTLEQITSEDSPIGQTPGAGGSPLILIGVLACLGGTMMITSFLLRLGAGLTLGLGVALMLLCQVVVPDASLVFEPMNAAERLFFVPGHDGILMVMYPILPWVPVCLFGMAYGHAVKANPERALKAPLIAGVIGAVLFVAIRSTEGFGTHHPMPGDDWMALFTVTKYPPSIAFILLSLSANALVLAVIVRAQSSLQGAGKALLVFGRAPLFFYVAHLYLYSFAGFAYPGATSLYAMYPVWIVGLVLLYPACVWYTGFKGRKSEDSLWRLL
jgi:uncharacterized membrane protein